jgi:hypothetical protein
MSLTTGGESPPTGQPAILGVVNGLIECLFAYPDRRLIDPRRKELAAEVWRQAATLCGLPAELPPWRIVKEKRAIFAAAPPRYRLTCGEPRRRRILERAVPYRDRIPARVLLALPRLFEVFFPLWALARFRNLKRGNTRAAMFGT